MKEDSGSTGQGWLTCTNMCLCENVLGRVCASAHACMCAFPMPGGTKLSWFPRPLQWLWSPLHSPQDRFCLLSPRYGIRCRVEPGIADTPTSTQNQTASKRTRQARADIGPVFPKMEGTPASGLRHIHAHTPGGERTIRSENSMQIS